MIKCACIAHNEHPVGFVHTYALVLNFVHLYNAQKADCTLLQRKLWICIFGYSGRILASLLSTFGRTNLSNIIGEHFMLHGREQSRKGQTYDLYGGTDFYSCATATVNLSPGTRETWMQRMGFLAFDHFDGRSGPNTRRKRSS